jgi:hypothetical protein
MTTRRRHRWGLAAAGLAGLCPVAAAGACGTTRQFRARRSAPGYLRQYRYAGVIKKMMRRAPGAGGPAVS